MYGMINTYTTAFENQIKDKYERRKNLIINQGEGRNGGTRIREVFNKLYIKSCKPNF